MCLLESVACPFRWCRQSSLRPPVLDLQIFRWGIPVAFSIINKIPHISFRSTVFRHSYCAVQLRTNTIILITKVSTYSTHIQCLTKKTDQCKNKTSTWLHKNCVCLHSTYTKRDNDKIRTIHVPNFTDRNKVSSSDPLRKNENTLLLSTLNNTSHTPKKRSLTKKETLH